MFPSKIPFLLGLAGAMCIMFWVIQSILANHAKKLIEGSRRVSSNPSIWDEYEKAFQPSRKAYVIGCILLVLALITYGFSPLAPPWRS